MVPFSVAPVFVTSYLNYLNVLFPFEIIDLVIAKVGLNVWNWNPFAHGHWY